MTHDKDNKECPRNWTESAVLTDPMECNCKPASPTECNYCRGELMMPGSYCSFACREKELMQTIRELHAELEAMKADHAVEMGIARDMWTEKCAELEAAQAAEQSHEQFFLGLRDDLTSQIKELRAQLEASRNAHNQIFDELGKQVEKETQLRAEVERLQNTCDRGQPALDHAINACREQAAENKRLTDALEEIAGKFGKAYSMQNIFSIASKALKREEHK